MILQEAEAIRRLRTQAEAKTAELIPAMFEAAFGDPVGNLRKWPMGSLAELIHGTPKNGLYKPADHYGEGTPIIRIGDFTGGILTSASKLQRLRVSEEETEQFGVSNGQILINRVNSIEHLGKSLLVANLAEPTVYESNMMRLAPRTDRVLPEFLIACLHHSSLISRLRAKAKKAINQASINQTDVLTLTLPVPPLPAQKDFLAQVSQVEATRVMGTTTLKAETSLSAAISAHAFSGRLTVDWREAHDVQLTEESQTRDAALSKSAKGRTHYASGTAQVKFTGSGSSTVTPGPRELSCEQSTLLATIKNQAASAEIKRYFTADMLSRSLTGALRRNPQLIEGHLAVLAARGLVIPVSREEQTADTGEYVFGNAWRLPNAGGEVTREEASGERTAASSGRVLVSERATSDSIRLRELERLAAHLEKERALL